jgi:hypothetical protein
MSTAEAFYDAIDDDDDDDDDIEAQASSVACDQATKIMEGVDYTTYTFRDRSTITFGSNGFVGSETPS